MQVNYNIMYTDSQISDIAEIQLTSQQEHVQVTPQRSTYLDADFG